MDTMCVACFYMWTTEPYMCKSDFVSPKSPMTNTKNNFTDPVLQLVMVFFSICKLSTTDKNNWKFWVKNKKKEKDDRQLQVGIL